MAKRGKDDGESGRKLDTSKYSDAELESMKVDAAKEVESAVKDASKAQENLNKLKQKQLEQEEELLRLKEISASRDKLVVDLSKRTNGYREAALASSKRYLTNQLSSISNLSTQEARQEKIASLEAERNNLLSGAGGINTRYNAEKAEAIAILLEQLKLDTDIAKINEMTTGTAEEQSAQLLRMADTKRLIINLSSAELDLIKEQGIALEIVDQHAKNLISDLKSGIADVGAVFSKIPIIGGFMNTALDKLNDSLSDKLTTAADNFKEKFADNLAQGQGTMKALTNSVSGLGTAVRSAFAASIPLLFLAALAIGIKKADELEQAAIDMRKALGGSAVDANQMSKELVEAEHIAKKVGGSLADVSEAAKTLREELGSIEPITSGTLAVMVSLNKTLGIANQKSAQVVGLFENLGGLTQQAAAGALLMTTQMATAAGLSAETIVNDIADAAKNGTDLYLTVKGGAKEIAKMAIQARLLGTSIESAVKSSKTLLDFEQNIQDELEASAILGANLNFQKARELAFNGDIVGSQREIMNQLRAIGDIGKLSLFEKEALSKATGMEIEDLTKMQRIQKQFPGIEKEKLAAAMKLADKYGDISRINDEMLESEVTRAAQEEKMRTTLQQLGDEFSLIGTQLAMFLVPLGKLFLGILKFTILPALQFINMVIGGISEGFNYIGSLFDGWGEKLSFVSTIFKFIGGTLGSILIAILAIRGVQMVINGLAAAYNGIKNMTLAILGREKIAQTAAAATQTTGAVTRGVTSVAGGAASVAGGAVSAAGATTTAITMLSLAAAMIAFAAAIYILAKAFQEFDKVKDMGKTMSLFAASVLGMVVVLGAAALLSTSLAPILTGLAIVLVAFGVSVLLISSGMYIAAKAFEVFTIAINNFGPALTSLSAGITAFAASPYLQFGIGLGVLGLALVSFAGLSSFILAGVGALFLLGIALSAININFSGLTKLSEVIKEFKLSDVSNFTNAVMKLGLGIAALGILGILIAPLIIAASAIQIAFNKLGNIDTSKIENLNNSIAPLRSALISLAGLVFIAGLIAMGMPVLGLAFLALAFVMPSITKISETFTNLSTSLTDISNIIPKITEQIISLATTNFEPINQLADSIFNLADALSNLSMQSILSIPFLSKIKELTGMNIGANVNVPVRPVATSAVNLPLISTNTTTEKVLTNREIESQQFTKDLLNQIIGLRTDLNQGKVAVYLDGVKVMKELKGVDSRELVTDRPRR